MSYFTGQHGNLRIATPSGSNYVGVAKIRDWSVNFQMDTLDTSTLGDVDRTKLPGLRSFDGSATVLYYSESNSNFSELTKETIKTAAPLTSSNAKDFGSLAGGAGIVQMQLKIVEGTQQKTCGFSCYVTGWQMTCSTGEIFQASMTFTGHGAPHAFDF